ncbi:hypothetical protein [Rhodanobacter sp. A1T4]|uniref:hypothetical protein n=1 Tax=Rhodanobacter sp. A1T4 TaxID=2723087 RepID=UPI0016170A19|nr:hypothetical protein [Rhodanobacter sp. A1T4]MBB6249208.1 UDP-N-acetylmuramyl pentapeptide phosphotransferase/UDP-N-acetylglucosamine-1-phosphate transferase [Rhodanobacter sp. A1T4]
MLAEYKRTTNIGVGLGIIGEIVGRALAQSGSVVIGGIILLAGFAVFIWGCSQYAKAKGHSPWFGAFGILSLIGLLVLFFLTDRYKEARA